MVKKPAQVKASLSYPEHVFSPEDLIFFVETQVFSRLWHHLGLDDEDDLAALQLTIMLAPESHPVIEGTGGVRKMRFVPPSWKTGKSGGVRICYCYFEDYSIVLLILAYDKHRKDDLTDKEKKTIRGLVAQAEKELRRRGTLG